MIRKFIRQLSSHPFYWGSGFGIVFLLSVVSLSLARAEREFWICAFYAILASCFLAAQVVGFILSQTHYCQIFEEAKFKMLENEEAEWK